MLSADIGRRFFKAGFQDGDRFTPRINQAREQPLLLLPSQGTSCAPRLGQASSWSLPKPEAQTAASTWPPRCSSYRWTEWLR